MEQPDDHGDTRGMGTVRLRETTLSDGQRALQQLSVARGMRPCIQDLCLAITQFAQPRQDRRAHSDAALPPQSAAAGVDVDLSQHYIGDSAIFEGFGAALLSLRLRLVRLSLPRNGITSASIPTLVLDCLSYCEVLEFVDLSDNRGITATAGRSLVKFVKARPSLRELRLEGTQLFAATRSIIEGTLQDRRRHDGTRLTPENADGE